MFSYPIIYDGVDPAYQFPFAKKGPPRPAIKFIVNYQGKSIPIVVQLGDKGMMVVVKNHPMVEFHKTDNYDKTGYLMGPLRKPKSEEMFKAGEVIPPELQGFNIVYQKDYRRKSPDRLGVLVKSSDIDTMINYALTRAILESKI